MLVRGLKDRTRETYLENLSLMVREIGKDPRKMTREDLRDYFAGLVKPDLRWCAQVICSGRAVQAAPNPNRVADQSPGSGASVRAPPPRRCRMQEPTPTGLHNRSESLWNPFGVRETTLLSRGGGASLLTPGFDLQPLRGRDRPERITWAQRGIGWRAERSG
jgi:hypothetical protein